MPTELKLYLSLQALLGLLFGTCAVIYIIEKMSQFARWAKARRMSESSEREVQMVESG
jgi:hypothetical protein